jgi:hypothetical protein
MYDDAMSHTSPQPTASTVKNEAISATAQADRLLNYKQVHALIGSTCKTGHTARALAARGQIRCVRLNGRVRRYSEASVLALIAGKGSA